MAVKPDSQCTNSSKVEFRNSPQQAVQDGFLHIPRAPENIPSWPLIALSLDGV